MGKHCASCLLLSALAVVLAAAPAAMGARPYGADYSHWTGDITADQWATIYSGGWVFGWTKATESPYDWTNTTCGGSWYTDNTFVNNMERARAAGIYMGCYHFAHPECNTAVAEATGFVTRSSSYIAGGYFRPVLDLEDGYTLGATALSTWVNTFCDTVEAQTGVEPLIYTNSSYATSYLNSTVAGRDLWVAQYWYTPDPQNGTPSYGVFNTWAFWQYADNGTVPPLTGGIDVNVFNGLASGLSAYLIPGYSQAPYIVESRSGGQHYSNYSETGTWSDGSSKSSAAGCTSGIGHRWCTIGSSGYGVATFAYTPTVTGTYEIFTTNCTTSNSGNPLIHKVNHAGGQTSVGVCQNTTCSPNAVNVWYSLGQYALNANTAYSVVLDGSTAAGSSPASTGAGRSDAIKWTLVSAGGPTISGQPSAQAVCSGSNASFSVTASGQGTLTYQWQKAQANITNGGHYSGCTTSTLAVTGATSADAANYRCVVTDSTGSTTSNEASLTINAATTITTQPTNQSVVTGGTATFTVAATGNGTLTYQWLKGGANVTNGGHYSGCTTATLTISTASSADAASYSCTVTGGCGSATSNTATLTVTTAITLVSDNFDSYASQSAFVTAWPAAGTSLTLSTAQYYSSPKSIYAASGSTAYQNKKTFTETIGTTASPLTLQFRFYDGGGATANQWVELRDYSPSTKQLIQFGVYSGQSSTYYSARVTYSPGSGWATTSVARSTGWHLLKVVIKSTTMDFYVDGTLASSNRSYASAEGAVSWEELRVGSNYASTSMAAYYDDVSLIKGQ